MAVSKFYLCTFSPVHIGCNDVYEPDSFVMDEKNRKLVHFDPADLMEALSAEEKESFMDICKEGSISSILSMYRFLRGRNIKGRPVEVCPALIEHYRACMALPPRDSKKITQELNRFIIERTAYDPHTGQPYIPGSSIKGAMRTAYLNMLKKSKGKAVSEKRNPEKLEKQLLDGGSFGKDPFRLLKVSDFMPSGHVGCRVNYAVNLKKERPWQEKSGPFQILETIEPGALFEGTISVENPIQGSGIASPLTMSNLMNSVAVFFMKEHMRENEELSGMGLAPPSFGPFGKAPLIRAGRHSGAECLTIEGHRRIKIKEGGGKSRTAARATTIWLAAPGRDCKDPNTLQALGWMRLNSDFENASVECAKRRQAYVKVHESAAGKQGSSGTGVEKIRRKPVKPRFEAWSDAALTWNPGNKILTATSGRKKAICHGSELIPETFYSKLFGKKKKPVKAEIEVEVVGNGFRIVRIDS